MARSKQSGKQKKLNEKRRQTITKPKLVKQAWERFEKTKLQLLAAEAPMEFDFVQDRKGSLEEKVTPNGKNWMEFVEKNILKTAKQQQQ
jgi:hypothetical protein